MKTPYLIVRQFLVRGRHQTEGRVVTLDDSDYDVQQAVANGDAVLPPSPPGFEPDSDYVVVNAFRFRGHVLVRDAFFDRGTATADDKEALRAFEAGDIRRAVRDDYNRPPPPPPPPPPGLYRVTHSGGITLGWSGLQAGPGVVVYLGGGTAQTLGECVERLNLQELIELERKETATR